MDKNYRPLYKLTAGLLVVWTIAITGSLVWNIYQERQQTRETAIKEARANFNKDLAFRLWGTKHGGVYVPATEETPPNPYLSHIPERDIQTPSGKRLTLMNPAYMLRQLMSEYNAMYGIKGHITSLKALNPANAPDEWEREALESFQRGAKEIVEFTIYHGEPYLRLMLPLVTQKGCLKCHAHQGYKEGDIRGGVGVSVPMKNYLASERITTNGMYISHGIIWLVGLTGIGYIFNTGRKNILENSKVQEVIKDSEERYRTLAENLPGIIYRVFIRENSRIQFFNKVAESVTGYTDSELAEGKICGIDSIIIAEDRNRVIAEVERAIIEKRQFILEYSIRHKDGSIRHLFEQGMTIYGADAKPLHIDGVILDVTARKKAEEFIKSILESVGEGFIVIDREYKIISANKAFCDAVNLQVQDVTGRHCYEVSHHIKKPCHESREDCPVKRTFETGQDHTAIHIHHDREEKPLYVEIRSYPMKDKEGNIISVIEILNDITEKKRLEDQLRESQKMEAIGRFAAGISHDFNNILTAIIGYANIVQLKMKSDDPLRKYVVQILASSDRAANLTQSLLTFSRRKVGKFLPLNLNDVIRKVEKLLTRIIGEDLELRITLTDKDVTVIADSGQIEQVLMNLATNARDVMPDGGVLSITTEILNLDNSFIKEHGYGIPGKYVLMAVSDTGKGIDRKIIDNIFEPFFTTKEVGKGTGLGLSIVYGIVKQHSGYINCYSEENKGTTFKVYLPLVEREKSGETEVTGDVPPPRGNETVILGEDDEPVRKLMREVIENAGYTVIDVANGEEVVEKFMQHKDEVSLLVLDIIMPKKGGKEAFEEIRKHKVDMKILFMSGYPEDYIYKLGIVEKGIDFIMKPVSPSILLKRVREVLDK